MYLILSIVQCPGMLLAAVPSTQNVLLEGTHLVSHAGGDLPEHLAAPNLGPGMDTLRDIICTLLWGIRPNTTDRGCQDGAQQGHQYAQYWVPGRVPGMLSTPLTGGSDSPRSCDTHARAC